MKDKGKSPADEHLSLVTSTRARGDDQPVDPEDLEYPDNWLRLALEDAQLRHPAGKKLSAEELALTEVVRWNLLLVSAREGYERSLLECRRLAIPNTRIAHRLGKSEAAIRTYLRRKTSR